MLPRANRLPLKPAARFTGATQRFPGFTLITRPNPLARPRLAVIIPNRVLKSAVARNRLKRQLHGCFIRFASGLPAQDMLLVVASDVIDPAAFTDYLKSLSSSP
ncbi:hypothetical protein A2W24_00345 [Microgenomates group bacterium RBG_16_45_19]|nr:MAG: hypothetical protein A2W24_00345 [Microgenomates group bacterium RBG_16_45_19]